MTIKGLSAGALIGCWLIAGCYGMKPEMKEGQSHWLTACSDQADCSEGQLCACGVCTVECEDAVACGAEALCADVEDREACDEAPASVASVCLDACEQDDDCGSASLECTDGACVAASEAMSPDAALPDAGEGDSSTPDATLTCADIHDGWVATVDAIITDEDHTTCEWDSECTCPSAGVECSPGCLVVVNEEGQTALSNAATSYTSEYCPQAASCSQIEVACTTCAALCVNNRCVDTGRTPCSSDSYCAEGQICHIDGTCLAPGVPNENGVAPLLGDQLDGFGTTFPTTFDIRDNTVYWIARLLDEVSTGPAPAALFAMDLDTRAVVNLAGPFQDYGHNTPVVAGDRVVFEAADGVWSVARDGSTEPLQLIESAAEDKVAWRALSDGILYYLPSESSTELRRIDVASGVDQLLVDAGDGVEIRATAANGDHLYVELYGPEPSLTTRLVQIDKATGSETMLIEAFRESEWSDPIAYRHRYGNMFIADGMLISDRTNFAGIEAHSLATGEPTSILELGDDKSIASIAVLDGFVYYTRIGGPAPAEGFWRGFVERVSIQSGATDRYATLTAGDLVVSDGYVYWSQSGRVVRAPL